jgi:hypothetical protein
VCPAPGTTHGATRSGSTAWTWAAAWPSSGTSPAAISRYRASVLLLDPYDRSLVQHAMSFPDPKVPVRSRTYTDDLTGPAVGSSGSSRLARPGPSASPAGPTAAKPPAREQAGLASAPAWHGPSRTGLPAVDPSGRRRSRSAGCRTRPSATEGRDHGPARDSHRPADRCDPPKGDERSAGQRTEAEP